jgi:uncharacterized protein YvpB
MRPVWILAVASAAVVLAGCASGRATSTRTTAPPRPLVLYAAGKRIEAIRPFQRRFRLPNRITVRHGRVRQELAILEPFARRQVRHALRHAVVLNLPVAPLWTTIALRPVRQVLHNNCEATALSMLLAAAGVRVGQLRLQARLPRSGPLAPEPVAGGALFRWGDPDKGFVGRPAGGGTEGGFGVYEPPVRALAARYGVHLLDLHGRSLAVVRHEVLAGHPVLAWVGLADGPFLSWLTPAGRKITVNLNEHAVTLVGAGPGYVLVNNPLTGRRERWSNELFGYRWKLLGRRALGLRQS